MFLNRPERSMKSKPNEKQSVVEDWELSSDEEHDDLEQIPLQSEVGTPNLGSVLKIKKEKIELLEAAVKNLNERIGTENIKDDRDDAASGGASNLTLTLRRYKRNPDVNTIHYQTDSEFGKDIYYITDVRVIETLFTFLNTFPRSDCMSM